MAVDEPLPQQPKPNSHSMVVYKDKNRLDDFVYAFLNEGLMKKQLCVFATVNFGYGVFEKMSSNVIDFNDNIKNGNLLMVELNSYLSSIMNYDLTEFRKLKRSVSNKVRKRANKHVRVCGDLVCHLYKNENYNQCFFLERWWQKNPLKGTRICPYPSSIIDNSPIQIKRELFDTHDDVIVC